MENIYLIQNGALSFDMDVTKIASTNKFRFFLLINEFSHNILLLNGYEKCFEKIWLIEDFSFENLKKIIDQNQLRYPFRFRITTNSEEGVIVTGLLRQNFCLDPDNYDRFINKQLMKYFVNQANLLYPDFLIFSHTEYSRDKISYINQLCQSLAFPLIVKPINSGACRNVMKANNSGELKKCLDRLDENITYEVDEFIAGKIYNCDSYIKNNKIIFTQVSECSNSCYDFMCGMTKGTIALPHDDPNYHFLSDYTIKVHHALGMPIAGVTHLEVIFDDKQNPYFLEIAHRSPGILIPKMYEKYLNISTIESHVLLQIDDDYELSIQKGPYCAWVAFPTMDGVMKTQYKPVIQSSYQLKWMVKVGERMFPVTSGRNYAGCVLLWNDDYNTLRDDFYYLSRFVFYDHTTAITV